MPETTFEITKCTIDEDQRRVATQWARTFIYNPSDTVNNMMQLVMACVGRGDFKIRDFMSMSSELHSPSKHLTISDYLSHGSRIIIDYYALSDEYIQELLTYFPEASSTNSVISRSATHDVKQVNEKAVEGKSFMLGVKGQLPSLIKTPRDYGLNIAMGGAGQNNYYGKKISANGFSGHVYYHRNTEHQLLLVGLEQTAPSASVLDLLLNSSKYPEDVQQGHDQFGQGHSLTGASDTYTAAGSLYFSNPVYQAKLLLEKGIFPPDKYGAMQVTITDENWVHIKELLKNIRIHSGDGNETELLEALLEMPSTAEEYQTEYKSYIALNFNDYFKQIYNTYIQKSEMGEESKSNVRMMQANLLDFIKKLQFGMITVYPSFYELFHEINSLEHIPKEYIQAVGRLISLFERQLMIDPEFKNTQVLRPYQLGDLTFNTLNDIYHAIHHSEEEDEGYKDYEFGDISWAILNRVNQMKGNYYFGSLTYNTLSWANQKINGGDTVYQFGDITSGLYSRLISSPPVDEVEEPLVEEKITTSQSGYRFGDFTRYLIWGGCETGEKLESKQILEEGKSLDGNVPSNNTNNS